MRIKSAWIDGYGVFHNQAIDDLGEGVVLFSGANEAGKSTMLSFIVTMLYGSRRRAENSYEPLAGGRHGGVLHAEMADGSCERVERYFTPSDKLGSVQAVGGMSRDLYTSIFAFGLNELVDLSTLTGSEVSSRIFSAGAGLGASTYAEARHKVSTEMDSLYTRSSRNRPIDQARRELEQAEARIREIHRQRDDYSRLVRSIDDNSTKQSQLQAKMDDLRRRQGWLQQLIATRPTWESLVVAEENLNRLTQSRDSEAEQHDALLISMKTRISAIRDSLERFRDHVDEISKLQVQMEQAQANVDVALAKLGPGWTRDRAVAFDTSIEARQRVRRFRESLQSAESDCGVAGALRDAARESAQAAARACCGIEAEIQPYESGELPTEEDARALLDDVNAAQAAMGAFREARAQSEASAGSLDGAQRAMAAASEQSSQAEQLVRSSSGAGRWLPPLLILLASVLAIPAAGWISPLLGVATSAYLWFSTRSRHAAAAKSAAAAARARQQATADLASMQARAETAKEQAALAQSRWEQSLARVGLKAGADESALAHIADRARSDLAVIHSLAGLKIRLQQARAEVERTKTVFEQASEALATSKADREGIWLAWGDWLLRAGLDESSTPEAVLDLIDAVESVNASLISVAGYRALLERIRQKVNEFIDELNAVRSRLKLDVVPDENAVPAAVEGLIAGLSLAERREDEGLRARNELNALREQIDASYPGELGATARDHHGEHTAAQIRQDAAEVEEALNQAEEELRTLARDQGRLTSERKAIEGDDALAIALVNRETARRELEQLTRKWVRLAMCKSLMEAAVHQYETMRQPRVMQDASSALAHMTGGRWTNVVARVSELHRIDVGDANGASRRTHQLSYGTQQQLYLAVRCGLVREYSTNAEPLPVIIDDVLVNFDPQRARAAARVMADLSQVCQVLVFTCHPHVADYFLSTGKVTSHFQMESGKIRRVS